MADPIQESIHINTLYPRDSKHLTNAPAKYTNSAKSLWIPFIPNKIEAVGKRSDFWKSPHGYHSYSINKDHDSEIFGHKTNNSDYKGQYADKNRMRNELTIFANTKMGSTPGSNTNGTASSLWTFHGYGWFGNEKNSHGYAWSLVDTKGGCPSDVAGVHFKVTNFADGNNITTRDASGSSKSVPVANENYGYDWQFNFVHGIYRNTMGTYFSIPFYPNGDNFNDDATKINVNTGAYVFRNSNSTGWQKSQATDDDSFWKKGGYKDKSKSFRMNIITDANTATPKNALFCGIEFSIWQGQKGGAPHSRTFQIDELTPIPGYVADQMRGNHPHNANYWVVPPEYTTFNDFGNGRQYELNQWKPNYYGPANIAHE